MVAEGDQVPRTGIAHLPLHGGTAPPWLFQRMVHLSRYLLLVLAEEFGPQEVLRRLSDPFWFQALGCLLGFDWHSSGLTTVVCAALKEGLRGVEADAGLFIAGGKGRTSRRTPAEIEALAERFSFDPRRLVYASRMSAKVDSAALQDGYQVYHHTIFFTADGHWAVIQQGMNEATRYARRYHWLGDEVEDFVCEPHKGVVSEAVGTALNMVAREAAPARELSAQLAREGPERILRDLERLRRLELPRRHHLEAEDFDPRRLEAGLLRAYQRQPRDFEELLGTEGVGAKTVRALALVSEVVYGAPASYRDPARYSYAHGGKDGHPYPVDRETYDRTVQALKRAVERARLGQREKLDALRRLSLALPQEC
jgi:hypothetical protein